jgi:hypothetical protein
VTAPLINGRNAFQAQAGVGLQPTLSWSLPTLGTPTSYRVQIYPADPTSLAFLYATVYSSQSFTIPPGFLATGSTYYATITAQQAPWDSRDASINRYGYPNSTADCVTNTFAP